MSRTTSKFNSQIFALSLEPGSNLATNVPHPTAEELHSQNAFLSTRLETLSQQLDRALNLSWTLHSKAEAAQHNIELLEAEVKSLEAFVKYCTPRAGWHKQSKEKNTENQNGAAFSKQQLVLTEVWESWRPWI